MRWLVVGALLVGCGDDGASGPDGAVRDGAEADAGRFVAMPAAPLPPEGEPAVAALPELAPCPSGWRVVAATDADDAATCDPWPAGGRQDCGDVEAHFPGEPGCTTVGSACPADGWPAGLPGAGVVYVSAAATTAGDGSRSKPYRTLGQALSVATSGDVVAVGRGTYDETVGVPAGVEVRGACPAETHLASTSNTAVVAVEGAGVVVSDLRVSGGWIGVDVRTAGSSATIRGVVVNGATGAGIAADATSVALQDVVIRATRAATGGGLGRGLDVRNRADVTGRRIAVVDNREISLLADSSSDVRLDDVTITDTAPSGSLALGEGVRAQEGGRVELTRAVVAGSRSHGVVAGTGATARLVDAVVRDTQPQLAGTPNARGVAAAAAGRAELERVLVEDAIEVGVNVGGDSSASMSDVVVRDIGAPSGVAPAGRGVNLGDADATATRVLVQRVHDAGFVVNRSMVTVRDVAVFDVATTVDMRNGRGFSVERGATVDADRVRVERVADTNVLVGAGAVATFRDLVVRDVGDGTSTEEGAGQGLAVSQDGQATVSRLLLERYVTAAVIAGLGSDTRVELEDAVVRDGRGRPDGTFGRGLVAQQEALVSAVRTRVERASEIAVIASDPGSRMTLTDVRVVETRARASDGVVGRGLQVQEGAVLEATRVAFEDGVEAAAVVSGAGASATFVDLTITDTRSAAEGLLGRGLCLQGGASATVARAYLARNREVSLCAYGAETTLDVTDLVAEGTLERECAEVECAGFGAGWAAGAYEEAHLSVERFVLTDNALGGLQIARDGVADATVGLISNNPIGVNLQSADFDVGRISVEVQFLDNGNNLDTTELPVPDTSPDV